MMSKRLICIFILSIFILFNSSQCCFAGDPIRKLGRGLINTVTGCLEVFNEMGKETRESGDIAGFFIGTLKGILKGFGRTVVGVYEATTFLIPLPSSYRPVIEPEFVFYEE